MSAGERTVGPWTLGALITETIIRNVCELPDYTSPEDQPNLLQCTVDELDAIVSNALEQHAPSITSACNAHAALLSEREALLSLAHKFARECSECNGTGKSMEFVETLGADGACRSCIDDIDTALALAQPVKP